MATTSLNLSLQAGIQADIDRQVESGRFASAGDYVSELVREDQLRLEALERQLITSMQETEGSVTFTAEEIHRGNIIEQVREKIASRK